MESSRSRSNWKSFLLSTGSSEDEKRLRNNDVFNHTMFDKLRKARQEQDDYISNPPEVEEGVVECHRCGSRRVFSVSIQTRAPDEPMSTKAHCLECKNKWVQNS